MENLATTLWIFPLMVQVTWACSCCRRSGRSARDEMEEPADAAGIQAAEPEGQEGQAGAGRDGGSVHRGDCQYARPPAAQRPARVADATRWMAIAAGYGAWYKALARGFDQ